MQSVCCLPAVLSTGWVRRKDIFGLSVFGRSEPVSMPVVVLQPNIMSEWIVQPNWLQRQEMLLWYWQPWVCISFWLPVVFWHWVKQVTSPLLSRLRLNTFQRKTVLMRLRSSMPVLLLGLWSLLSLFPCWQKLGVGKWLLSWSVRSVLSGWVCGYSCTRPRTRANMWIKPSWSILNRIRTKKTLSSSKKNTRRR